MTTEMPDGTEPAVLPLDRSDFESFFKLDSPGYWLAKEAFRQGVIGTPYEMVEMVCAANKSFGRRLLDRLKAAVAEFDLHEYPEHVASAEAVADLVMATFGDDGFKRILLELHIEVAEEFHVSLTPSRKRMYEKYSLWTAFLKAKPN
jgi:hypothetical protein